MPLHDADSIPQGHELHSKAAASPFLHFRPFTVTGRQRAAGPTGVPAEVPGCWGRGMAWSGDRAPQIFCRKRQGIGRRAGSEPGPYRVFRRKCRGYWGGWPAQGAGPTVLLEGNGPVRGPNPINLLLEVLEAAGEWPAEGCWPHSSAERRPVE